MKQTIKVNGLVHTEVEIQPINVINGMLRQIVENDEWIENGNIMAEDHQHSYIRRKITPRELEYYSALMTISTMLAKDLLNK